MGFPVLSTLAEERARKPLGSPWSDDRWYSTIPHMSSSGIDVRSEDAIGITALWNALWIVGMSIATLPVRVYQLRGESRGRDVVRDHPVHKRLNWRPNPWMRPYNYLSTAQVHTMVFGTSYTQIVRNGRGEVVAMVPLHPRRMQIEMRSGQLAYKYNRNDGEPVTFDQDEVMHLSGLSPTGVLGYNPIEVNAEAIGSTLAIERHKGAFFKNYAQTSLVAEHPGELGDKAYKRLKESLESRSGGDVYKPMVVEEGMKVHTLGLNAEDAQLIAAARLQVEEISRITNVPVPMLKNLERATFSNIEHQAIEFVTHTIRPWVVIWQQCMETDLLTEEEREDGLIVRFSVEALLQGDHESQANWFKQMHDMGVYSPNDIRVLLDENPYEGGDVYTLQVNRLPVDQLGLLEPGDVPPDDEGERARPEDRSVAEVRQTRSVAGRRQHVLAHQRTIRRSFQRLVNQETRAARDALHEGPEGDLTEFEEWLRTFYSSFPVEVARTMSPTLIALAMAVLSEIREEVDAEEDVSERIEVFTRDYAGTLGTRYTSHSKAQLRNLIDEAESPESAEAELETELDQWHDRRAKWETMKESHRLGNAVAMTAYGIFGVRFLRWVTIGESCPLCSRMDGRKVRTGSPFLKKGDTVDAEGANPLTTKTLIRHPPLHGGCDCLMVGG